MGGLPSQNMSGNSSTIKSKKKSSSIDKKSVSMQMNSGAELKKSIPKKGIHYEFSYRYFSWP